MREGANGEGIVGARPGGRAAMSAVHGADEPRDAWAEACDAILAGICHELNGRVGAVGGLVQLARLSQSLDDETGDLLESEVERLTTLVRLLEQLRSERGKPPEPLHVPELASLAASLLRRHRGLEDVTVEIESRGASAVVAPRGALLEALVVLLAAAGRAAHEAGSDRVRLVLEDVDGRVSIGVVAEGGTGQPAGGGGSEAGAQKVGEPIRHGIDDDALDAAARRAVVCGGSVAATAADPARGLGAGYRIRLPAMAADP